MLRYRLVLVDCIEPAMLKYSLVAAGPSTTIEALPHLAIDRCHLRSVPQPTVFGISLEVIVEDRTLVRSDLLWLRNSRAMDGHREQRHKKTSHRVLDIRG